MKRRSDEPLAPLWSRPVLPPLLFGEPENGSDVPPTPFEQADIDTANAPKHGQTGEETTHS